MRTLIENLLLAQKSLRTAQPVEKDRMLTRLQKSVPSPVLAHFLRLIEQGRNGVTLVRHGVCSGCHLKVPSGILAALARPTDLHLCENCGSYLLLPPEEVPAFGMRNPPTVTAVRRGRGRPPAVQAVAA